MLATRVEQDVIILDKIEDIIEDMRNGKMVVLMDDEDRENEGDLIVAASKVTAEHINFMARYARGLICLTLTAERCEALQLPLMVAGTNAKHLTNFTVSIEAAIGVTTGISAQDRATTILAAVTKDAGPDDIVQPGHIFPLMAQPGGVLARAGHTEAGCDLARLAGQEPASVIVEILSEDGSMARRPELMEFAKLHGLRVGTVEDLIRYRHVSERHVDLFARTQVKRKQGEFQMVAFREHLNDQVHLALVYGDIDKQDSVMVRVHVEDHLCDPLGLENEVLSWTIDEALDRIVAEGAGVVVIIRTVDDQQKLMQRIKDMQSKDEGVELNKSKSSNEVRMIGVGSQILVDLGVKRMRVLGAPKIMHGLSGFGLEIVAYIEQ